MVLSGPDSVETDVDRDLLICVDVFILLLWIDFIYLYIFVYLSMYVVRIFISCRFSQLLCRCIVSLFLCNFYYLFFDEMIIVNVNCASTYRFKILQTKGK